MRTRVSSGAASCRLFFISIAMLLAVASALPVGLFAQDFGFGRHNQRFPFQFYPGNLVVSRTVYDNRAAM